MDNVISSVFTDQDYFNVLKNNKKEDIYKLFNTNLKRHISKFPNLNVKELILPLVENQTIRLGYPDKNKNLILGQILETYDYRIAGVVLNTITHDIDFDGNSLNFDKIIGSIYYIIIEYALRKKFSTEIVKNDVLVNRTAHYFEYILIKNLKLFELYAEKKILFTFLVNLFFKIHLCNINPNIAYNSSITPGNENLIKESIQLSKISKYKNILSLYDALYDFKVLNMTPNNMKYLLTNNIGIFSFITIHNSLSSLIASIVCSKYKHPNFALLFISVDNINAIEKVLFDKFLNRLSFDYEILNNRFKAEPLTINTKIG